MSPSGGYFTVHRQHEPLPTLWCVSQGSSSNYHFQYLTANYIDLFFPFFQHHHYMCFSDNLYNTNSNFDWGIFRLLEEKLTLSWTPPALFSLVFSQPGAYVFTLSSNQHKHMVKFNRNKTKATLLHFILETKIIMKINIPDVKKAVLTFWYFIKASCLYLHWPVVIKCFTNQGLSTIPMYLGRIKDIDKPWYYWII